MTIQDELISFIIRDNPHLTLVYDTQLLEEPTRSFALTFQTLATKSLLGEIPMFASSTSDNLSTRISSETRHLNGQIYHFSFLQFSVSGTIETLNRWCERAGFSMQESVLRLAAHEIRHCFQRLRRKQISWRGTSWFDLFYKKHCSQPFRHLGASAVDDEELVRYAAELAGPNASRKHLRQHMLHERDAEITALAAVIALRANLGTEFIVSLATH